MKQAVVSEKGYKSEKRRSPGELAASIMKDLPEREKQVPHIYIEGL